MRFPLEVILTLIYFIGVAGFAGCPTPASTPVPPPVSTPDLDSKIPACSLDAALPTSANVCDGMFTVDGLSCVKCPSTQGCIDTVDVMYCVIGSCTADKNCMQDPGAATSKRTKKSIKRR